VPLLDFLQRGRLPTGLGLDRRNLRVQIPFNYIVLQPRGLRTFYPISPTISANMIHQQLERPIRNPRVLRVPAPTEVIFQLLLILLTPRVLPAMRLSNTVPPATILANRGFGRGRELSTVDLQTNSTVLLMNSPFSHRSPLLRFTVPTNPLRD